MSGKAVTASLAVLSLFCLFMAPLTGGAFAQQACGPRDGITKQLAERFQEVPAGRGQINEQAIMELLLSPSGSWTILGTDTQKRSCVVMGGDAFEFVAPEPVKPGRGS